MEELDGWRRVPGGYVIPPADPRQHVLCGPRRTQEDLTMPDEIGRDEEQRGAEQPPPPLGH